MAQRTRRGKKARRPTMPMHAGPKKRDLVNKLKWLLKFLNLEVPRLPTGDFLKVAFEVLEFLYLDQVEGQVELGDICTDTTLNREALERIQGLLKWHLNGIVRISQFSLQEEKAYSWESAEARYNVMVKDDRVIFRPAKKLIPYGQTASFLGQHKETPLQAGITADEEYLAKTFRHVDQETYVFFSNFFDPVIDTSLLLSLVPLLERFPLTCIRVCPACHKYFHSTRGKESPLCSVCLKKVTTYKWREENREVYNEYQRNLRKGVKERPTEIRERLIDSGAFVNERPAPRRRQ